MKNLTTLNNCNVCARNCLVNRNEGKLGFCRSGATVKVAKAYGHMWEEPCISGEKGFGDSVFFKL